MSFVWSMYAPVQNSASKLAEIFSRRIEWCPKKIFLIVKILENAISSGKKKTNKKSHKSVFECLSKNTRRHMKLKYLDQLRKKTSTVSSWSRRHFSPIDNCSLFIRYKKYKWQATSNNFRQLLQHSQQQWGVRREYSFFSLQQNQLAASNNFIRSFPWTSEWRPRD